MQNSAKQLVEFVERRQSYLQHVLYYIFLVKISKETLSCTSSLHVEQSEGFYPKAQEMMSWL